MLLLNASLSGAGNASCLNGRAPGMGAKDGFVAEGWAPPGVSCPQALKRTAEATHESSSFFTGSLALLDSDSWSSTDV